MFGQVTEKNECIMTFQDDEWPGTSGREVTIYEEYQIVFYRPWSHKVCAI